MSDFARYCPKCYQFFRDLDLFTKHVEICGFAKETAGKRSQETEYRRRQGKEYRSQEAEVR